MKAGSLVRALAAVGAALLLGIGCSSSDSAAAPGSDAGADVDYGDGPTTFRPDSDVPPDTRAESATDADAPGETSADDGAPDGDASSDAAVDAPPDADAVSSDGGDGG